MNPRPNARPRGWSDDRSGALYVGEWLSFAIHNIHGLEPHEWFLSSADLRLDCIKLDAPDLATAKEEGRRIAFRMTQRYQDDLLAALRSLAQAPRPAACTRCHGTGEIITPEGTSWCTCSGTGNASKGGT